MTVDLSGYRTYYPGMTAPTGPDDTGVIRMVRDHRKPVHKAWTVTGVVSLAVALGLFLVALVVAVAPAPAHAGTIDWSKATTAPVSGRTVEVVDRIGPKKWNVKKAVRAVDRYTGSRVKMVSRCSPAVYRCIVFRTGKVSGNRVALSKNHVITVDLGKAHGKRFGKYYRKAHNRTWLLKHEFAHTYGLGHSSGRNVMNHAVNRKGNSFTAAQKRYLGKR